MRYAASRRLLLDHRSAPHRAEAFAGAREIIDRLKAEVPIWKQEEGEWVDGATPATPS